MCLNLIKKVLFNLLIGLVIFQFSATKLVAAPTNNSQDFSAQARIERVLEEKEINVLDHQQLYQKLELIILDGEKKGDKVILENGNQPLANVIKYKVKDKVLLNTYTDPGGKKTFIITDFVRNDSLFLLLIIFLIVTIWVARGKGVSAIISMIFTFGILFTWVLPSISAGNNPVLIATLASMVIIPISFYLSHGFNKKTTMAIFGSIISLIIVCVLAYVFIDLGHLTGLSSEEAGLLAVNRDGILNMRGILLAGIVIGALGVLDDITVSQSAIVEELAVTAKLNKTTDLYKRAMGIGKDHITSMVNTLVLAYAGASLPLLLIFVDNPHPLMEIINYEMIAEEIIRTLVGSIGLVLAVPITTIIAAIGFRKR